MLDYPGGPARRPALPPSRELVRRDHPAPNAEDELLAPTATIATSFVLASPTTPLAELRLLTPVRVGEVLEEPGLETESELEGLVRLGAGREHHHDQMELASEGLVDEHFCDFALLGRGGLDRPAELLAQVQGQSRIGVEDDGGRSGHGGTELRRQCPVRRHGYIGQNDLPVG
jgi:hypothetical protein